MKKKLYILILFQTLIISAFGITVTTTAPNTGVSKVMTVDNGKVYELNFNADVFSSSKVEVNIKELGSTIASQQISTNGNHALTFTPTSNAITIEFNRINSGTASLQFEVDNIQLKEVVSSKLTHEVGTKNYELSDHLGNVRTTVSDKKDNGSSKVISANDYYPFGMEARSVSNGEYRFGFNGMEKDNEMTEGNYDFGARIYDSRLGKWLAVDPKANVYISWSSYHYVKNDPINNIDVNGEYSLNNHENYTNLALKKLGYRKVDTWLIGHYASVFADGPPFWVQFLQNNFKIPGIDYSATKDSQEDDIEHNTWHSMARTDPKEKITAAEATRRGQSFGWGKILEAANEVKKVGGMDKLTMNSKGIQALGQGIHAIQDAVAHKGVTMDEHDVINDMYPSDKDEKLTIDRTFSALLTIEVLSGDYSNLKEGMTVDLTGTTQEQYDTIKAAFQKGVNENKDVSKINILGKPPKEEKKE